MNLYEFEGRKLFAKHAIKIPRGVVVRREDSSTHSVRSEQVKQAYESLGVKDVVVKVQILSGKRGKNNGIRFCSSAEEVKQACEELFNTQVRGQYVSAILITEKIEIGEEHYLSITYDTSSKQPVLMYSREGGVDIEEVSEEKIEKYGLDVRNITPTLWVTPSSKGGDKEASIPYVQELWNCFLSEDCRVAEINPLVKTKSGEWVALDAKVALDDDAFFRHEEWNPSTGSLRGDLVEPGQGFEPRTMLGRLPTERENAVRKIDEGEAYYRGTAGKYIELDGDIAVLFSGGGASIANMDALIKAGLKPANYTEYSGNPPREKVYALTKIVLSKPNLRGLWIVGGVANFTDIAETFGGIVDALNEIKPTYPIVVRRAGPNEEEGLRIMRECAEKNNLNIKIFGKETSMSETAGELAKLVQT